MSQSNVSRYIHTSVSDAQISLNCILDKDPKQAKNLAECLLVLIADKDGHASRIKMAKAIVRKADKAIKKELAV
ncbi:hypothetical protein [Vibrio mimicus]|uniref:hypothetical protein n=1 Tax=Vibrio mimicus TaxID=674 RepID=UPI0001BADE1E|nr:hypothetical protein [Vibrio mimicus]EEY36226.1 hypothetical protein VII_003769 [Vibrio mimicus MB451]